MNEKTSLQGRVAKILNARELVINIGQNQGVKEGMIFAVLAEAPLIIKDPETGEQLGELDREKVRVRATEVNPKITVCKTYRQLRTTGFRGIQEMLTETVQMKTETLKADDASYPEPLSPEESYVRVKDRVVLVDED